MEPKCGQGNFLTKVHDRRNKPSSWKVQHDKNLSTKIVGKL